MHQSVIERFKPVNLSPIGNPIVNLPPQETISPIIEPEKLREELIKAVNPTPQTEISTENPAQLEFISFANVFEFVYWYELNKDKFTSIQQKPLDNLVAARNMATGGCNCDIGTRKAIAADWFRKFWINNKHTDLLPTLLNIANVKKVVFGNFLSFP